MKIVLNGEAVEVPSGGGVTIDEVNEAINAAITGAIEEVYYGTTDAETTV